MIVPIIHRRAPIGRRFALEQRQETAALDVVGHFFARGGQQRRGEVDVDDHAVVDASRFDHVGPANQERHSQRFFVHEPFVEPVVIAQEKALVRRVDHDRIVSEAVLIEVFEHASHIVVDRSNACQIVAHVSLVLPLLQFRVG